MQSFCQPMLIVLEANNFIKKLSKAGLIIYNRSEEIHFTITHSFRDLFTNVI